MPDNIYIEEPESQVDVITLDIPIYNPDTDSICKTPKILGWAIEDSVNLLVGADLLLEGVELVLNTGETAIVRDGLAIFDLENPLYFGQEIWAEVNTEECQARSCSVYASRIANVCLTDSTQQIAGTLTGRLICVEKDLFAQVYDGDGGVYPGIKKQEDCIICGGSLPNCLEPPIEETTFYNIIGCNDGLTYQTITELTTPNQRVVHANGRTYKYANTTTTTATAYIGTVNIATGQTNCPTVETACNNYEIIGGVGGGTYYYIDCLDGQTYGPYNLPETLISNRCARNAWGTNVTVNKGTACGF
jgi:hypothetical protein